MIIKFCLYLSFFFISIAQAEEYRLPFKGTWFVAQAGDTTNVNHHMRSNAQAYGIDFAKVGGTSNRELTRSDGTSIEHFYSWSQLVLAPIDGVIVAVVDGLADNKLGDGDKENVTGNYLTVETKNGKYVFLAHFKKDSIIVKVGDRVSQGEELGLSGNSGNSDYPHIHMHVQSEKVFGEGIGKNIEFGPINVQMSGKQFNGVKWPLIRGLFVSN